MKYVNTLMALALFAICLSCNDDDGPNITNVADSSQNGALLEIINTSSNTIFEDSLEGSLDIDLEYRDGEQGTLLDNLKVYVTYSDNSENAGDSSNAIFQEVLLKTVESSVFNTNDADFPTYNLQISTQEFLNASNNTLESIAVDDNFFTRFEVTLTDGRVFSIDNTGNNGGLSIDFFVNTRVQ